MKCKVYMDQITSLSVGVETEEGVKLVLEGIDNVECEDGSNIPIKSRDSLFISRSEAEDLTEGIDNVLNSETLTVNGKTKITEVRRRNNMKTALFIEPYNYPSAIELSETHSIRTNVYEIGTDTSGSTTIRDDTHHNISEVEGCAFEITSDNKETSHINMYCGTILSEIEYDGDNEEIVDISVPDTPKDSKYFNLPVPGCYRVWECTTEIESN